MHGLLKLVACCLATLLVLTTFVESGPSPGFIYPGVAERQMLEQAVGWASVSLLLSLVACGAGGRLFRGHRREVATRLGAWLAPVYLVFVVAAQAAWVATF